MESKKTKPAPSTTKRHYFWVTCKHCKQKLAIPPDWVFKHLQRVQGYEHEEKVAIPT